MEIRKLPCGMAEITVRMQGSELVVVEGADHNYKRRGTAKILIEHMVHFLVHGAVLPAQGEGEGVQRFPQSSGLS